MTRGWAWGAAVAALVLVVGLSIFGGRTYVDLSSERAATARVQRDLLALADSLAQAHRTADSLQREGSRVRTVYRDRVREVPPDTVLVGLPSACDDCVARSRRQDAALAAADSALRVQDSLVTVQSAALRTAQMQLGVADSSLTALRGALADRQVSTSRKLLGVPLPEVVAGYGVTLAHGEVTTGPQITLGWRVRF